MAFFLALAFFLIVFSFSTCIALALVAKGEQNRAEAKAEKAEAEKAKKAEKAKALAKIKARRAAARRLLRAKKPKKAGAGAKRRKAKLRRHLRRKTTRAERRRRKAKLRARRKAKKDEPARPTYYREWVRSLTPATVMVEWEEATPVVVEWVEDPTPVMVEWVEEEPTPVVVMEECIEEPTVVVVEWEEPTPVLVEEMTLQETRRWKKQQAKAAKKAAKLAIPRRERRLLKRRAIATKKAIKAAAKATRPVVEAVAEPMVEPKAPRVKKAKKAKKAAKLAAKKAKAKAEKAMFPTKAKKAKVKAPKAPKAPVKVEPKAEPMIEPVVEAKTTKAKAKKATKPMVEPKFTVGVAAGKQLIAAYEELHIKATTAAVVEVAKTVKAVTVQTVEDVVVETVGVITVEDVVKTIFPILLAAIGWVIFGEEASMATLPFLGSIGRWFKRLGATTPDEEVVEVPPEDSLFVQTWTKVVEEPEVEENPEPGHSLNNPVRDVEGIWFHALSGQGNLVQGINQVLRQEEEICVVSPKTKRILARKCGVVLVFKGTCREWYAFCTRSEVQADGKRVAIHGYTRSPDDEGFLSPSGARLLGILIDEERWTEDQAMEEEIARAMAKYPSVVGYTYNNGLRRAIEGLLALEAKALRLTSPENLEDYLRTFGVEDTTPPLDTKFKGMQHVLSIVSQCPPKVTQRPTLRTAKRRLAAAAKRTPKYQDKLAWVARGMTPSEWFTSFKGCSDQMKAKYIVFKIEAGACRHDWVLRNQAEKIPEEIRLEERLVLKGETLTLLEEIEPGFSIHRPARDKDGVWLHVVRYDAEPETIEAIIKLDGEICVSSLGFKSLIRSYEGVTLVFQGACREWYAYDCSSLVNEDGTRRPTRDYKNPHHYDEGFLNPSKVKFLGVLIDKERAEEYPEPRYAEVESAFPSVRTIMDREHVMQALRVLGALAPVLLAIIGWAIFGEEGSAMAGLMGINLLGSLGKPKKAKHPIQKLVEGMPKEYLDKVALKAEGLDHETWWEVFESTSSLTKAKMLAKWLGQGADPKDLLERAVKIPEETLDEADLILIPSCGLYEKIGLGYSMANPVKDKAGTWLHVVRGDLEQEGDTLEHIQTYEDLVKDVLSIKGEISVSSTESQKLIWGVTGMTLVFEGTCREWYSYDCHSRVGEDSRRCATSGYIGTPYDEGFLCPVEAKLLGLIIDPRKIKGHTKWLMIKHLSKVQRVGYASTIGQMKEVIAQWKTEGRIPYRDEWAAIAKVAKIFAPILLAIIGWLVFGEKGSAMAGLMGINLLSDLGKPKKAMGPTALERAAKAAKAVPEYADRLALAARGSDHEEWFNKFGSAPDWVKAKYIAHQLETRRHPSSWTLHSEARKLPAEELLEEGVALEGGYYAVVLPTPSTSLLKEIAQGLDILQWDAPKVYKRLAAAFMQVTHNQDGDYKIPYPQMGSALVQVKNGRVTITGWEVVKQPNDVFGDWDDDRGPRPAWAPALSVIWDITGRGRRHHPMMKKLIMMEMDGVEISADQYLQHLEEAQRGGGVLALLGSVWPEYKLPAKIQAELNISNTLSNFCWGSVAPSYNKEKTGVWFHRTIASADIKSIISSRTEISVSSIGSSTHHTKKDGEDILLIFRGDVREWYPEDCSSSLDEETGKLKPWPYPEQCVDYGHDEGFMTPAEVKFLGIVHKSDLESEYPAVRVSSLLNVEERIKAAGVLEALKAKKVAKAVNPEEGMMSKKARRRANKAKKRAKANKARNAGKTVKVTGKIFLDKEIEASRKNGDKSFPDHTHFEVRLMQRLGVSEERVKEVAKELCDLFNKKAPKTLIARKHGGTARLMVGYKGMGAALIWVKDNRATLKSWFPIGCHEEAECPAWAPDALEITAILSEGSMGVCEGGDFDWEVEMEDSMNSEDRLAQSLIDTIWGDDMSVPEGWEDLDKEAKYLLEEIEDMSLQGEQAVVMDLAVECILKGDREGLREVIKENISKIPRDLFLPIAELAYPSAMGGIRMANRARVLAARSSYRPAPLIIHKAKDESEIETTLRYELGGSYEGLMEWAQATGRIDTCSKVLRMPLLHLIDGLIDEGVIERIADEGWVVLKKRHLIHYRTVQWIGDVLFNKAVDFAAYGGRLFNPCIPGTLGEWKAVIRAVDVADGTRAGADGHGLIHPEHPWFKAMGITDPRDAESVQIVGFNEDEGVFIKGIFVVSEKPEKDVLWVDHLMVKGNKKSHYKALSKKWDAAVAEGTQEDLVEEMSFLAGVMATMPAQETKWCFQTLEKVERTPENEQIISSMVSDFFNGLPTDPVKMAAGSKDPSVKLAIKMAQKAGIDPMAVDVVRAAAEEKLGRMLYHVHQGAGKTGNALVAVLDKRIKPGTCWVNPQSWKQLRNSQDDESICDSHPQKVKTITYEVGDRSFVVSESREAVELGVYRDLDTFEAQKAPEGDLRAIHGPYKRSWGKDHNCDEIYIAATRYPMLLPQALRVMKVVIPPEDILVSGRVPKDTIWMSEHDLVFGMQGDTDGDRVVTNFDKDVIKLYRSKIDIGHGPEALYQIEPQRQTSGYKAVASSGDKKAMIELVGNKQDGPVGLATLCMSACYNYPTVVKGGIQQALAWATATQEYIDVGKHVVLFQDVNHTSRLENWGIEDDEVYHIKSFVYASDQDVDAGTTSKLFAELNGKGSYRKMNWWRGGEPSESRARSFPMNKGFKKSKWGNVLVGVVYDKKIQDLHAYRGCKWLATPKGPSLLHYNIAEAYKGYVKWHETYWRTPKVVTINDLFAMLLGDAWSKISAPADYAKPKGLKNRSGLTAYQRAVGAAMGSPGAEKEQMIAAAYTNLVASLEELVADEGPAALLKILKAELENEARLKEEASEATDKIAKMYCESLAARAVNRGLKVISYSGSPIVGMLGIEEDTDSCTFMSGRIKEIRKVLLAFERDYDMRDPCEAAIALIYGDKERGIPMPFRHLFTMDVELAHCENCRSTVEKVAMNLLRSTTRRSALGPVEEAQIAGELITGFRVGDTERRKRYMNGVKTINRIAPDQKFAIPEYIKPEDLEDLISLYRKVSK